VLSCLSKSKNKIEPITLSTRTPLSKNHFSDADPTPGPSAPAFAQLPLSDCSLASRTIEKVALERHVSFAPLEPSPTKCQTKRKRKRAIKLMSFTTADAERTLLTFIGSVNGHPAHILIDGGAEGNVISATFAKQHSLPLVSCSPIPIILPDGSSSITNNTASITLARDTYHDTLNPLLYNLQKYDLILGKPWLANVNPKINWRTNALHFTHNNLDVRWVCRGFAPSSVTAKSRGLVLSHLHFNAIAAQHGSEVFVALVKIGKDQKSIELPPEIHPIVHSEFPDVFPDTLPYGLPQDRGDEMKIETLPDTDPPFKPVIRLSTAELDELRKQLDDLLKKGFIKPSTSPYGAPVLFVRKKDGTLRMCVDYRGLNRITIKNRHPLPRIDELIDRFRGARFFTKLDLISGYHQQRIFEPHTHKTAFRCRYGHFEFNVVPFGLTNAPAAFSTMMARALDPVLDKCVVVYLDDILIYSKSKEEHLAHIRSVLSLLRKNGLYAKLSKCSFMQEETEFLGHVVSKNGIHTSAGHVKAITEWPTPKKQKDVQQFVGLAQFYHQYIDGFASIAFPLTSLLGEGTPFSWGKDQVRAFTALKKAISKAPVLRIFDPDLPTTVETDASGFALGAVLFQTDEYGESRPVAYTSRKLNSAERNYPTHEQELLAVVHALKKWRYYLDGSHFVVYTDHATLQHFPTQPKLTRRQARWMELLQEYDFDFRYKRGADNIVPDALSRRPDHQEEPTPDPPPVAVHSLTIELDPGVRQRLIDEYPEDHRLGPIYQSCLEGSCPPRYFLVNDLLCTVHRGSTVVCIPRKSDLRLSLLHDAHDSAIAGHLGFDKTYSTLHRSVYWPKMSIETREYIKTCESCQRNKSSHQRPAGLLQPLEIPEERWQTVTMDFIVQLPKTPRGYDAITVFVDKLSKQVHFAPSHTTDTASDVARIFFDNVFRLHGMPTAIVSDRDTKFTSRFWKELHRLLDVKLAMSTAFHPQTDGQTERANQTLEAMLRAFVDHRQTNWDLLLTAAEFAYNNSKNATTGFSPFFLNSGTHPRLPASLLQPASTPSPSVNDFVEAQGAALTIAKDAIAHAQEHQARNADTHRRDHDFKIGDKVMLNSENITLDANRGRPSRKLAARMIGPYTIVAQHSPVSFRLELCSNAKIHDVFHVDRFHHYHASPEALGPRKPSRPDPKLIDGEEEWEAEVILNHRQHRNRREYLIQWTGYSFEGATWEPESNLTNCKELLRLYKSSHGLKK